MTVGERIKQRRKELGLSADYIAEKLGVSRSTVFRYENGYIEKLPADSLEPVAAVLGTTVARLMGWDEEQEERPKGLILSDAEKELIDMMKKMSEEDQRRLVRIVKAALPGSE